MIHAPFALRDSQRCSPRRGRPRRARRWTRPIQAHIQDDDERLSACGTHSCTKASTRARHIPIKNAQHHRPTRKRFAKKTRRCQNAFKGHRLALRCRLTHLRISVDVFGQLMSSEALIKSADAGAYAFVDNAWASLDGGLSAMWLFKNKDNSGARLVAKSTSEQKVLFLCAPSPDVRCRRWLLRSARSFLARTCASAACRGAAVATRSL